MAVTELPSLLLEPFAHTNARGTLTSALECVRDRADGVSVCAEITVGGRPAGVIMTVGLWARLKVAAGPAGGEVRRVALNRQMFSASFPHLLSLCDDEDDPRVFTTNSNHPRVSLVPWVIFERLAAAANVRRFRKRQIRDGQLGFGVSSLLRAMIRDDIDCELLSTRTNETLGWIVTLPRLRRLLLLADATSCVACGATPCGALLGACDNARVGQITSTDEQMADDIPWLLARLTTCEPRPVLGIGTTALAALISRGDYERLTARAGENLAGRP